MQRQEQNSRCHCDKARKTLHLECPAQHCHSNTVHTIVSPRAGEQALTRCTASHYSKHSEHAQHEPEPPCRARLLAATVAVEPSGTDAGCAHHTARGALIPHRAGARALLGGQSTGSTEPTRGTIELQGNSTHTHTHTVARNNVNRQPPTDNRRHTSNNNGSNSAPGDPAGSRCQVHTPPARCVGGVQRPRDQQRA